MQQNTIRTATPKWRRSIEDLRKPTYNTETEKAQYKNKHITDRDEE